MARAVCFCGPSGVGKSSLIRRLVDEYPGKYGFSVSYTTRKIRPGEEDGVAYNFVSKEVIEKRIQDGLMLEYAHVHGNIYGTGLDAVKKVNEEGKICILDIDVQGVRQVQEKHEMLGNPPLYIFILPPSLQSLEDRLRARGTETEESLTRRLQNATAEIECKDLCPHHVVNDELDRAYCELKNILSEGGCLPEK